MESLNFYAANLLSFDCEKSAILYSTLFSFSIVSLSKNHSELRSSSGFCIFFSKPSIHCNIAPGSISFSVKDLDLDKLNLEPLQLEFYHDKEKYISYLDEYSNRIWVFQEK